MSNLADLVCNNPLKIYHFYASFLNPYQKNCHAPVILWHVSLQTKPKFPSNGTLTLTVSNSPDRQGATPTAIQILMVGKCPPTGSAQIAGELSPDPVESDADIENASVVKSYWHLHGYIKV